MKKHEIVWYRVASRVEGNEANVAAFIAAVPGGHLVSTTGPGAPGLCFVPGKSRAVEKLIPRPAKKVKKVKEPKKADAKEPKAEKPKAKKAKAKKAKAKKAKGPKAKKTKSGGA